MRLAPPVRVRCAGGRAWRALRAGLPALALASAGTWALLLQERPPWPAWLAALLLAAGSWRLLQPDVCMLEWDGTRWAVDGHAGAVDVMVDLGRWLLLRQRPPPSAPQGAHVRWLAVTATEAGPAMHGLRAALYAPAPPAR